MPGDDRVQTSGRLRAELPPRRIAACYVVLPAVASQWAPRRTGAFISSLVLAFGTLAILVFPGLGAVGLVYMMPMGLYEVGLGIWLLVKGIQAPIVEERLL